MTYDNIKSHKKAGFYPPKRQRGGEVKLTPPAVLGLTPPPYRVLIKGGVGMEGVSKAGKTM